MIPKLQMPAYTDGHIDYHEASGGLSVSYIREHRDTRSAHD
jgi:hypothetical protein